MILGRSKGAGKAENVEGGREEQRNELDRVWWVLALTLVTKTRIGVCELKGSVVNKRGREQKERRVRTRAVLEDIRKSV